MTDSEQPETDPTPRPEEQPAPGESPETIPRPAAEAAGGVDISLGPLQTVEYEKRQSPDEKRRLVSLRYGKNDQREPRVFITMQAMRKIEAHGRTDLSREIGGVMMGEYGKDEKGLFIEIVDAIPAEHVEHSSAQIKFTHKSWVDIDRKQAEQCPDLKRVGWYHTHPGFGVFLSHMDVFIHEHFFGQPGNIAYVYDPVNRRRAFFRWSGKKIQAAGGFMIFAGRKDTRQLEEHMQRLASESAPPGTPGGGMDLSSRLLDQIYNLQRQMRLVAYGQFILAGILTMLMFWGMLRIGELASHVATAGERVAVLEKQSQLLKIAERYEGILDYAEAEKYLKMARLDPSTETEAVRRLVSLYERTRRPLAARDLVKSAYAKSPKALSDFYLLCLADWLSKSEDAGGQKALIGDVPDELIDPLMDRLEKRPEVPEILALQAIIMSHPNLAYQEKAHRILKSIGLMKDIKAATAKLAADAAEEYVTAKMGAATAQYATDQAGAKKEIRRLLKLDADNTTLKDLLKGWEKPPEPDPSASPTGGGGG